MEVSTKAVEVAFETRRVMAEAPSSFASSSSLMSSSGGGGGCGSDVCLICLSNPDDYECKARGLDCGMCSACGTFYCCECKPELSRRAQLASSEAKYRALGWDRCPACREPLRASHEENVTRLERLLRKRSEGRHVVRVQYKLGLAYELGRGAAVDEAKAAHYYGLAAAQGNAQVRCCLRRWGG